MKILIATPAYNGTLTTKYFASALETAARLSERGIEWEFITLATESLIPRGRNRCVSYALDHGFDKLLFIDADMIWEAKQVEALIDSGKEVVGGTYPIKAFPVALNFNPFSNKGREIFGTKRTLLEFEEFKKKYAENGLAQVQHVPTGFLLIDCVVFKRLIKARVPQEYINFDAPTGERKTHYDFFPIGVTPHKEYLSEDWAFCEILRANDIPVYLHTECVTGHTGVFHYWADQAVTGAR